MRNTDGQPSLPAIVVRASTRVRATSWTCSTRSRDQPPVAHQHLSVHDRRANIFAAGMAIDQAATVGAALYAGLVAIMFASGGHHVILRALVESYDVLPAAGFPNTSATARAATAGTACRGRPS